MNAMTNLQLEDMTTAQLIAVHNELAGRHGAEPLTYWKRAKAELIERIDAFDGRLPDATEPEATENAEPVTPDADDTPEPSVDEKIATAEVHGTEPKRTIGSLVQELLMDAGLSYAVIVDMVVAEFPAAKTTARSVASVAAVMRKRGADVPMRRKQ